MPCKSTWAESLIALSLKPVKGLYRNLTGNINSTSSTTFVFSGYSNKQDGRHDHWLAEILSTSSLKPLTGIFWNLTGSKHSSFSTNLVFFRPISKRRPKGSLIADSFSTIPLEQLNGVWLDLTGSKILTSSTKFMFCAFLTESCTLKNVLWHIWRYRRMNWHICNWSMFFI